MPNRMNPSAKTCIFCPFEAYLCIKSMESVTYRAVSKGSKNKPTVTLDEQIVQVTTEIESLEAKLNESHEELKRLSELKIIAIVFVTDHRGASLSGINAIKFFFKKFLRCVLTKYSSW